MKLLKVTGMITLWIAIAGLGVLGCEYEDCWYGDDDCWGHRCDRPDPFDENCLENHDCIDGFFCNHIGGCEASGFCDTNGSCPEGYECDDRFTCVPESPSVEPCETDEDCSDGYCPEDEPFPRCIPTGSCEIDEDCSEFGAGLACDDRGICVPETEPCESGTCGCTEDSECDDGLWCLESRCVSPAELCMFDFECGAMGVCLNNECHVTCTEDCPVGQCCTDGICMDSTPDPAECTFDEDCGEEFACIDATCHPRCTLREECGFGEACVAGVCRADTSPIRGCDDETECDEGMTCLRGQCRLPCVAPINCPDEMSVCGEENICLYPSEVAPSCQRQADCPENASCVNGQCVNAEG